MQNLPSYIDIDKATKVSEEAIKKLDDKTIYETLKQLPDFDRFPLPKSWYEMFQIPPPKIPTLKEALKAHYESQLAYLNSPDAPEVEIRPPAEGGVRPVIDAPIPELKVIPGKTLKDIDLSGNIIDETPPSEESQ